MVYVEFAKEPLLFCNGCSVIFEKELVVIMIFFDLKHYTTPTLMLLSLKHFG